MAYKKKISVIIHSYHHRSKHRINCVVKKFLSDTSLNGHCDLIITCIDELIKNAVKANYKYMVMLERPTTLRANRPQGIDGQKSIHPSHTEDPVISRKVREILNEQARFNDIMDRAYNEGRPLTDVERLALLEFTVYNAVSAQMRRNNITAAMTLVIDEDTLHIHISNTAPIIESDLARIHEKLRCIRKLRSEGREHEFFTHNLDTSQAGFGLGYALIDSCCHQMDVDTEDALAIRAGTETAIEIDIPLKRPVDDPCEVEFIEVA